MDSLPIEAFQLICSFCSLHTLANLRLVSTSFLNRVDGSLTARRTSAHPERVIGAKDKHDADACYIRITLGRNHDPINVVFDNFNREHNYLEFVQRTEPARVSLLTSPLNRQPLFAGLHPPTAPAGTLIDPPNPQAVAELAAQSSREEDDIFSHTLGRLDFNLWEQQAQQSQANKDSPPSESSQPEQRPPTNNNTTPSTAGGSLRSLANSFRSYLNIQPSTPATGSSLSPAELAEKARQLFHKQDAGALSAKKSYKFGLTEGVHYVGDNDFIMRYTILPNMVIPTAVQSQEATVAAVVPATAEAAAPPLQTQGQGPQQEQEEPAAAAAAAAQPVRVLGIKLRVDYIRVSWKWITSGSLPIKTKAPKADVNTIESMIAPLSPLQLRIGGIYTERFQSLLKKIKRQEISTFVRGELALMGYNASSLPRDFLSINMRSEPVLRWVTGDAIQPLLGNEGDVTRRQKQQERKVEREHVEVLLNDDEDEGNDMGASSTRVARQRDEDLQDSDWEDLAVPVSTATKGKGRMAQHPAKDEHMAQVQADQAALEEVVRELKAKMGYLTVRHILEGMLAEDDYSHDLVWKYGVVRRELESTVLEPEHLLQLFKKVVANEVTINRWNHHRKYKQNM